MFKIISWNVNGLSKRMNELELLTSKYEPEIFLVQETHLNDNAKLKLPKGYYLHRKDRQMKRKGGVAILIRDNVEYAEEQLETGTAESLTISVQTSNKKTLYITSVYCPPNAKVKKPDLFKLPGNKPSVIIAGDFNAKNESWGHQKTNVYGKWTEEFIESCNLKLHIPEEPTRKANSRTDIEDILDYTITSDNINIKQQVLSKEFNTSDHIPVLIEITSHSAEKNKNEDKYETRWDRIEKEIDRPYFITYDVDYDVSHLTTVLQCALLNNTNVKKRKKYKVHANKEIKELISKKHQADKAYAITRSLKDKEEQRKLKRKLNKVLKEKEQEDMIKRINSLNDPLQRWQTLKKGKPTPPPIPTLTKNNKQAKTTKEKVEMLAEGLSERFTELPTNQEKAITQEIENYIQELNQKNIEEPVSFTMTELAEAIKALKKNSVFNVFNGYERHSKDLPEGHSYRIIIFISVLHRETQLLNFPECCLLKVKQAQSKFGIWKRHCNCIVEPLLKVHDGRGGVRPTYVLPRTNIFDGFKNPRVGRLMFIGQQGECHWEHLAVVLTVNDLSEWCDSWKTKINPNKSVAMHVGRVKRPAMNKIMYKSQEISQQPSMKYLGVILDTNLNFNLHVTHILEVGRVKTASLRQYLSRKHITTTKTRIELYNSLIKPTMTYGLPAWSTVAPTNWAKLEMVEKGWAKYVQHLPILTPSEQVLNNMPFATLHEYRRSITGKLFLSSRSHTNQTIRHIPVESGNIRYKYPLDGDFLREEILTQLEQDDIDSDREIYLQDLLQTITHHD
ncbi:RNA-directed DNA polymerase from mobile element jockey [Frankliniella fusca]|uniref:RNA-directed DNA polymerase from mobile element jockey n=1 Tax=Frankliniella fusca TaxID=407009 RepID=A0AAE1GVS3_9NEOP|nr:RNA-directed DNA polymerase from mobile element jockey [Frankliniella fusca]